MVVNTLAAAQEINELVYSNVPGPTKCYWIGISDIEHEDKYVYASDDQPILWTNFRPGFPVSNSSRNCLLYSCDRSYPFQVGPVCQAGSDGVCFLSSGTTGARWPSDTSVRRYRATRTVASRTLSWWRNPSKRLTWSPVGQFVRVFLPAHSSLSQVGNNLDSNICLSSVFTLAC